MESRTTRSFLDSIGLDVGPGGFEIAWKPRQRPKSLEAWPLPTQPPDATDLPGFRAADVEANRSGVLSVAQRGDIHKAIRGLVLVGAFVVGTTVLGLVAAGFNVGTVFQLIGLAIICFHLFDSVQDRRRNVVASTEGYVWKQRESDGEGTSYYLRVNWYKLGVDTAVYRRMVSGGPYRIFYLPLSERVVGGEPLPGWRASPEADRPSGIGSE